MLKESRDELAACSESVDVFSLLRAGTAGWRIYSSFSRDKGLIGEICYADV